MARPFGRSAIVGARSALARMLGQQLNFIGEPSTIMFRRADLQPFAPNFWSFAGINFTPYPWPSLPDRGKLSARLRRQLNVELLHIRDDGGGGAALIARGLASHEVDQIVDAVLKEWADVDPVLHHLHGVAREGFRGLPGWTAGRRAALWT